MRLLLTGATGFLGRHVVAAASGWEIVRVTRALRPSAPGELALGPTPWTEADFAAAIGSARPDVVLHCVGAAHSANIRSCMDANAVLAGELINAVAALTRPPRLVLIGSAAEYGFVPAHAQPVREDFPCAPRTDYAVAKHAQTMLGLAAAIRGQQVLVARLFNPVGAGMPSELALPSFARRILEAGPGATIRVGNLSAQRDFIDVREAARLLLALAGMPIWPWPVVNICSGRAYRLRDLLDGLLDAFGASVEVEPDPVLMRPSEMPVLIGSTERLAAVGLAPQPPDFSILLPRLLADARANAKV